MSKTNAAQATDTKSPADYMSEERAKRWARVEAHQERVADSKARIHGPSPLAAWTLTPLPFDPHAD